MINFAIQIRYQNCIKEYGKAGTDFCHERIKAVPFGIKNTGNEKYHLTVLLWVKKKNS